MDEYKNKALIYSPKTWKGVSKKTRERMGHFELAREIVLRLEDSKPISHYSKSEAGSRALNVFHPSEISGCLLRLWFCYSGERAAARKITAATRLTFRIGTGVHEIAVLPVLKDMFGDHCLLEEPISIKAGQMFPEDDEPDELLVVGHTDAIILVDILGMLVGVELKSAKKSSFATVMKKGPYESNLMQKETYLRGFNADIFCVLFCNKNDSELMPFYYEPDEEVWTAIKRRVGTVRSLAKKGIMPDPEPSFFGCPICPYKDKCPSPYGRSGMSAAGKGKNYAAKGPTNSKAHHRGYGRRDP